MIKINVVTLCQWQENLNRQEHYIRTKVIDLHLINLKNNMKRTKECQSV